MKSTFPENSKSHEEHIRKIADIILKYAPEKIAFIILFSSFVTPTAFAQNAPKYKLLQDKMAVVEEVKKMAVNSISPIISKVEIAKKEEAQKTNNEPTTSEREEKDEYWKERRQNAEDYWKNRDEKMQDYWRDRKEKSQDRN